MAITYPPESPAPGPRSTIQSEFLITSRLCSIRSTVLPVSTRRCSTFSRAAQSEKERPVVGSSSRYRVLPVARLESSVASFTRWASPPERVVAGWPRRIYPRPTSRRVSSLGLILGKFTKNSNAWSTVIARTSAMLSSRIVTSRASRLYRRPLQISQGTVTSGRNCISIWLYPSPWQASHLPPLTLKENRPGL